VLFCGGSWALVVVVTSENEATRTAAPSFDILWSLLLLILALPPPITIQHTTNTCHHPAHLQLISLLHLSVNPVARLPLVAGYKTSRSFATEVSKGKVGGRELRGVACENGASFACCSCCAVTTLPLSLSLSVMARSTLASLRCPSSWLVVVVLVSLVVVWAPVVAASPRTTYVAAAVQMTPEWSSSMLPATITERNVASYEPLIRQAAQQHVRREISSV